MRIVAWAKPLQPGTTTSRGTRRSRSVGTWALAPAAHDHLVAVFQEPARLAGGQGDGPRAAPRQLQQAAARAFVRARHGAARQQVAGSQVAAVAGVMRRASARTSSTSTERLPRAEATGAPPDAPHLPGREQHLEREVEAPVRPRWQARRGTAAATGRPRAAAKAGDAERRERFERDHPGRDGGREVLGEERPERLVLPLLDVARRPVVHEAEAEQVLFGLGDGDRSRRGGCPPATNARPPARSPGGPSGRTTGALRPPRFVWPEGRRTGVPLDTMDEARPW